MEPSRRQILASGAISFVAPKSIHPAPRSLTAAEQLDSDTKLAALIHHDIDALANVSQTRKTTAKKLIFPTISDFTMHQTAHYTPGPVGTLPFPRPNVYGESNCIWIWWKALPKGRVCAVFSSILDVYGFEKDHFIWHQRNPTSSMLAEYILRFF